VKDTIANIIENEIGHYEYCGDHDTIKQFLDSVNLNFVVDEPEPNVLPDVHICIDAYDASFIYCMLKNKLADFENELEIMREFVGGNGELWCHLPQSLMSAGLDERYDTVKENIDPWISQINHVKYLIEAFGAVAMKGDNGSV
jgi:hypothetical protein